MDYHISIDDEVTLFETRDLKTGRLNAGIFAQVLRKMPAGSYLNLEIAKFDNAHKGALDQVQDLARAELPIGRRDEGREFSYDLQADILKIERGRVA